MPKEIKNQVKRRITVFLSWLAGLSLGSVLFLIFATLAAVAIFVRTDYFQNTLRDTVVEEAQSNLGIKIQFESATADVFRLNPRLNFNGVRIQDPERKLDVAIERVSVSISLLLSLPLLLFDQVYLSSAEVSGLEYQLTDLGILEDWSERLKPKKTYIPARFQTAIGKIIFNEFRLQVDLNRVAFLKQSFAGHFVLKNFELAFGSEGISFEGDLDFDSLNYGSLKLPNGSLLLRDSQYLDDEVEIGSLKLLSQSDSLELSGKISRFEDPVVDISARLNMDLQNHSIHDELEGLVSVNAILKGPWKRTEGRAGVSAKQLSFRTKQIETLSAELDLKKDRVTIREMFWTSGQENMNLAGSIFFDAAQASEVSLRFENLAAGSYLGTFNSTLGKWDGLLSGTAELRGDLLGGSGLQIDTRSKLEDFRINHGSTGDLIYAMPPADLDFRLNTKNFSEASFSASLKGESAIWNGGAFWNQSNFDLQWETEFLGESIGKLFMFDLASKGKMLGRYSGPHDQMILSVRPSFEWIRLNEMELKKMSGEIRLEDRILSGAPLTAEGLNVTGGLYFPEGEGAKTLFSDFNFQFQGFPIAKVFASLPQTESWIRPLGTVSGSGILNEWVFRPKGQGNLLANNLGFGADATLGRVAKTNWRFDSGVLFLEDLFVQTSKRAGGLRGNMSFKIDGIREFNLLGSRVRMSDWLLLFGVESPVQSLANFELKYDQGIREFEADFQFIETIIAGRVQKPSTLKLFATDDQTRLSLNLFDSEVMLSLNSKADGGRADVLIQNLDLGSMVKELQRNGVGIRLSGMGDCEMSWTKQQLTRPVFLRFTDEPQNTQCKIEFDESQMTRGGTPLHRLEAFQMEIEKKRSENLRLQFSPLNLLTGDRLLKIEGGLREGSVNVSLQGETSLESVSYFVPFLSRSEGDLQVDGRWTSQGYTGSLSLQKTLLVLEDSPIIIKNFQANLSATNSLFNIGQLSGELQDGTVQASGQFRLEGLDVVDASVAMQLNGPLFEPQKGIRFRANGPLNLSIKNKDAKLSGQVNITEGVFRKRINLRGDILKLFQPRSRDISFFERESSYIDTWALDVAVRSQEPFSVRNNIAEGAIDLDLRLLGRIGKPILEGSLSLVEGQFNYFNRNFDVRSGAVQFLGIEENIPRYDIRAETLIDDYRVFMNFQGDKNEQKIIYSSDPPLNEKQILALVSYGTPPTSDASSLQEDPTTSAAFTGISFFTGALQDTIETALSSDLGIRRFNLYPAFYEETGRTELQLSIGTDLIRNRLGLNYSNFVSTTGGHQVELDFRVNPSISLVGSWRDTANDSSSSFSGDLGGDIVFRFEFE